MCCAWEYLKIGGDDGGQFWTATQELAASQQMRHDILQLMRMAAIIGLSRALPALCCAARDCRAAAVSDRARALHAGSLVFDGHVHAVDREFYHGGDIGQRKPDGQFDLPRAQGGRPRCAVLLHLRHRGLLSRAARNQAGAAHAGLRASTQIDTQQRRHRDRPHARRISSAFDAAARSPPCSISKAASIWMATRP